MKRSERYDIGELAKSLSPSLYLKSLGFKAFDWQNMVVESKEKRLILMCSRQAGKSTIVSSMPCHAAKYQKKSLSIVMAPSEAQAKEDMVKVKDFIARDPTYPSLRKCSEEQIELSNGSRIIVVAATDKSARGYSRPRVVVLDEASRIPDVVYRSGVVPMVNKSPDSQIVMLSTPYGQQGFFYDTWKTSNRYKKIFVRTPWDVDPDDPTRLIPSVPEDMFISCCAEKGIIGMYSPNHMDYDDQMGNLSDVGSRQYRQEFCCDFVEVEGQVFSNVDIDRFLSAQARPLEAAVQTDIGPAPTLRKLEGGRFF